MDFVSFKAQLKDFTTFSLADIRKIDAHFDLRRLTEWQQKGYIRNLIRGHYLFSDTALDEQTLFEVANRIYAPSYVSLETALCFYGIIPEQVYAITSVSTRRTYTFNTQETSFNYRTVKTSVFFGYQLVSHHGKTHNFAEAEKAVLDYFYLNPHIKDTAGIESLRYNRDIFFKMINRRKLMSYAVRFRSRALSKRIKLLMEVLAND